MGLCYGFGQDEVRVAEITSPKQGTFEILQKVDPGLRTVKTVDPGGKESVHHEGLVTDLATGIEVDPDAVCS